MMVEKEERLIQVKRSLKAEPVKVVPTLSVPAPVAVVALNPIERIILVEL